MNKIIISISVIASGILGYTVKQDKNKIEKSIENVKYIKEWVYEDLNSGAMDSIYAEYYLNHLEVTLETLTN